jgi:hypothetical protein
MFCVLYLSFLLLSPLFFLYFLMYFFFTYNQENQDSNEHFVFCVLSLFHDNSSIIIY